MGQEVYIDPRPVIDDDDLAGQTAGLAAETTETGWTDVLAFRTRTGRQARLSQVANAVDPGAENFMLFRILVNGVPISDPLMSRFGSNNVGAIGTTYEPGQRMTRPRDLPQNAYIQVQANLQPTAVTTEFKAYTRVKVEYVDF